MVHAPDSKLLPAFPGFPAFQANVTFVPIQFFTVVLPQCSRGTVRMVGYALRKVLGWVDEHGNPTRGQLQFTYRELIEKAGVSRGAIGETLKEAVAGHLLRCAQAPSPHLTGQAAQSAIYELCWDEAGGYTDDWAEFRGFYYPEAALLPVREGATVRHRPKAARKNIPNAFFDVLLPREPLSLIRVVGALMFYSIQWGPGGERKEPVCLSITELSRLTRLSRQHVHEAVMEACRRGYIEQVDAGCFDPAAGQDSQAATYGIRWTMSASPTRPVEERFKKVNGASVQKGEREEFKKVNGERFKKVNGISIKTELKTRQTAAGSPEPPTAKPAEAEAAAAAVAVLVKAGFDEETARRLASQCAREVIQRQVEWLPLRSPSRNRLGLLRRAIEQNWPKPEGAESSATLPAASQEQARLFASHYYAAYHGYDGPAATEPLPKDLTVAGQFLARLLRPEGQESLIPEWGREFGRMICAKHQGDAKAKPNLSYTLTLFGDQFLRQVQGEASTRRKEALGKAKERHQAAFYSNYEQYLRQTEIAVQRASPGLYADFLERRRQTRHHMTGGLVLVSAETLAKFDGERSRLLSLADFLAKHPQHPVLDFWEWDRRLNPHHFGSNKPGNPGGLQEAHP